MRTGFGARLIGLVVAGLLWGSAPAWAQARSWETNWP